MLTKTGVNSTKYEKHGPTVKEGIRANKAFKKIVRCSSCSAKLEKACANELVCDISTMKCPKCGAAVR